MNSEDVMRDSGSSMLSGPGGQQQHTRRASAVESLHRVTNMHLHEATELWKRVQVE